MKWVTMGCAGLDDGRQCMGWRLECQFSAWMAFTVHREPAGSPDPIGGLEVPQNNALRVNPPVARPMSRYIRHWYQTSAELWRLVCEGRSRDSGSRSRTTKTFRNQNVSRIHVLSHNHHIPEDL
jgi:hypothetical protein